jgi:hypothetical protein
MLCALILHLILSRNYSPFGKDDHYQLRGIKFRAGLPHLRAELRDQFDSDSDSVPDSFRFFWSSTRESESGNVFKCPVNYVLL